MSDSEVNSDCEELCTFEDIIITIYESFEAPHQSCLVIKEVWEHLPLYIEEKIVMDNQIQQNFEELKILLTRMAKVLMLKVPQNCQSSFTSAMSLVKKAMGRTYKTSFCVELKSELKKWLEELLPTWIPIHEACCLSQAITPIYTSSTTAAMPETPVGVSGERKSAKRKILNFEDDCSDSDEDPSNNSHLPTGLISSYISVQKGGERKLRILTER